LGSSGAMGATSRHGGIGGSGALTGEAPAAAMERVRLARDLHDGIAQDLWFMSLQAKLLQDALQAGRFGEANELVAELRQALENSYTEVRGLCSELLHPMEATDFVAELERLTQRFGRLGGLPIQLAVDIADGTGPSGAVATQLVWVAREALANIVKHAAARRVRVSISADEHEVRMVIADDGRGFCRARRLHRRRLGLRSMRTRVASLGGKLVIRSAPGHGTTLWISAPLWLDRARHGPTLRIEGTGGADWESPRALAAG
jgi:signal transduction histidine kinase